MYVVFSLSFSQAPHKIQVDITLWQFEVHHTFTVHFQTAIYSPSMANFDTANIA